MLNTLRRAQRGVTLLEMLVTVVIVGILLSVGVPSMGAWIRNSSVHASAEILRNDLYRAQAEAIRRNAFVEFLLTATRPTVSNYSSLTAAANKQNWAVRVLDSSYVALTTNGFVSAFYSNDVSPEVLVSGPASVVFNGMGKALTSSGVAQAAKQVYRLSRTDSENVYCVFVAPGGAIKLCDPGGASGLPGSCQPQLTAEECAP